MYELRLYKEVDCKMYQKGVIPGGSIKDLLMMAKRQIMNGEITHAVVYDSDGKEYGRLYKKRGQLCEDVVKGSD